MRQQGQRVSRHYYDVSRLVESPVANRALGDRDLALDCARHARLFFNSADLDLGNAVPGSLAIAPTSAMSDALEKDYKAMGGMIFGDLPKFDDVVATIADLDRQVNR